MKKTEPFAETRSAVTIHSEGSKLFGILHMPNTKQKVGAALFIHGFGGNKVGKYRLAVRQAEALCKRGIACLRFDLRGCGDSEGDFGDTTIDKMLCDIRSSFDFLQSLPQIDAAKIAICGRSLGGALALFIAEKYPIQTLVLWAPVFDAEPWIRELGICELGMSKKVVHHALTEESLNPAFLQEFSKLTVAMSLDALHARPLCIIQGQKDQTLDMYHYNKYVSARKSATSQTKTLLLPHSGHDFEYVQEQQLVLNTTTDWIEKWLN